MPFNPGQMNWQALSGLASGNTVGEQFGNVNNILAAQQPILQQKQIENKTLNYLNQFHPEIAAQVQAGMPMQNALQMVAQAQQPKKPNLMNVGDGLIYDADSKSWISPPADLIQNKAPELGLSPQYGVDANGNPVLLQLSKDGRVVQPTMPEGVKLSKEPIRLDAGTHFVLLDPITRQPLGNIPKNNTEEQSQIAEGKVLGATKASLPAVRSTAATIQKMIADVKNDPYRERATGVTSVFNKVPATGGYDFQAKVDQLKGQAFLQAIQQMQGFGALSNQEGQTATAAISRLDTAQSEEAFNKALDDLNEIIDRGVRRVEAMANNTQTSAQPDTASGVVDFQEYFK